MSVINNFFENFHYTPFYFLRNFYQVFPSWFLHLILIFCIFLWIYILILLTIILTDTLYNFYLKIYTCEDKGFINPNTAQTLFLPLIYKIYSPIITCIKILMYFFFSIVVIFFLRYLNLGKDLNLNLIFTNFSSIPLLYKLLLGILVICYILCIILYVKNIYLRLFLELKRMYIYLYQFGGQLDPQSNYYFFFNSNNNTLVISPYIITLFLEPLQRNSFEKFYYDLIIITRDRFTDSFIHEKNDVSKILRPLLYLIKYSKYRSNIFVKYLRYMLTQVLKGFWTVFKFIPVVFFSIYFLLSIFIFNGIFYKLYIILLIIYIYTLYINTIYFLAHNGKHLEPGICLLYYKFDYIKTVKEITTVYDQEIIELYLKTINKLNSALLEIYLKNELNFDKSIAIYYSKPWPLIRSDIGKYLEKLKNCISKHYLIKVVFLKINNFINNL